MEENVPNTPLQTVQIKLPIYRNKFVIVFIIIIFEALYTITLLNISKAKTQIPIKAVPSSQKMVSEDELPVGIDLLKNPIVNQWRGGVEGTLIAKDEKSITLANKGAEITIPLYTPLGKQRMTKFNNLKLAKLGENIGEIDLEEIPLGTYLRGDFFVIPWPNDKYKIVGSLFTVEEKAP